MAGLGGVLILLSLFGLYWNWRGTLASKSTYLKIMVATIVLPVHCQFCWMDYV